MAAEQRNDRARSSASQRANFDRRPAAPDLLSAAMPPYKLTKIIATLGPASSSEEGIRSLIRAGADCFRLNFSHADGPAMQPIIDRIRQISDAEGARVAILADIQGPKLRIGKLPQDGVLLIEGRPFTVTTREVAKRSCTPPIRCCPAM